MEYELIRDSYGCLSVLHVPTQTWIPLDPGNADYQRFLIWNAQQATPLAIEGE